MKTFIIIFSALLVILAQCGYPIPEYPLPPAYPLKPTYAAVPVPVALPTHYTEESEEGGFFVEGGHSATEFRKRAKARTAQNRKFHRRPLVPIRRFQQKKQ